MSYLLMYRFNKEGRYSEIGSSIETILNCSAEDDNNLAPSISNNDLTGSFPCLVAGFGAYFMGTDNFGITTGLRISYGFSDIISNIRIILFSYFIQPNTLLVLESNQIHLCCVHHQALLLRYKTSSSCLLVHFCLFCYMITL